MRLWPGPASDENLNGPLRQYLPSARLAELTERHCDALAHRLTTQPKEALW